MVLGFAIRFIAMTVSGTEMCFGGAYCLSEFRSTQPTIRINKCWEANEHQPPSYPMVI